jgi:hypothetical protein
VNFRLVAQCLNYYATANLNRNFGEELIAYFLLIRHEPHGKQKTGRGGGTDKQTARCLETMGSGGPDRQQGDHISLKK